jgi:diamine N-acetyltransferase
MAVLTGQTCRLRPVSRQDIAVSLPWRNDPSLRDQVMGYRFPVTDVMEADWYDRVLADPGGKRASFAIEALDTSICIGFVHLVDIDWVCRSAEIGIVIGATTQQRRGIGREAVRLAVAYAFQTLNLQRVAARFLASNVASARTFAGLGFTEEGRLRKAGFAEGQFLDVVVMAVLRDDAAGGLPDRSLP